MYTQEQLDVVSHHISQRAKLFWIILVLLILATIPLVVWSVFLNLHVAGRALIQVFGDGSVPPDTERELRNFVNVISIVLYSSTILLSFIFFIKSFKMRKKLKEFFLGSVEQSRSFSRSKRNVRVLQLVSGLITLFLLSPFIVASFEWLKVLIR